jgi:hypothetical protein
VIKAVGKVVKPRINHQSINQSISFTPVISPIQWVTEALSLGVKQPGREAGHSSPSSAEVKVCVELYLQSPTRLHGVVFS